MPLLNHKSLLPLNAQVQVWILRHIVAGTWDEGDMLPSHVDILKLFGANGLVVQFARRKLITGGILSTRPGTGTFVCRGAKRGAEAMLTELYERVTGALRPPPKKK